MKPNKLGIIFLSVHSIIVMVVGFCEFFLTRNEENRGALFLFPGILDKPVLFLLAPFLRKIFDAGDFFIIMPLLLLMAGGIQWYLIGWGCSKLTKLRDKGDGSGGDKT